MYAQKTTIRAPMGKVAQLRSLIAEKYLPAVSARTGFVAAYLLEQVDDPDACELIQFWDNQTAIENLNRTGVLQASIQTIAADLPGVHIQREGYIIRVAIGNVPELAQTAHT